MGINISTQLEPFSVNSTEWQERCFGEGKIVDHPEYYFPDGNIIVVVENTAFNLYHTLLQIHSQIFLGTEAGALRMKGPIKVEEFTILCEFMFPKGVGVLPTIQPGEIKKWRPIIQNTVKLFMPGVRRCILNKLTEDKAVIAANAVEFLSWIQDDDEGLGELLLECIRVLAYRHCPLSAKEARGLSGTRANQVAVVRERIRSLFYNPNYWKVRIPNTLCRAVGHHCSDGVFLAMTKQISISAQSSKSGPQTDLLEIAIDSMCTVCSGKYAQSVKQHANLEIRKCLEDTDETEALNPDSPNKGSARVMSKVVECPTYFSNFSRSRPNVA